MNLKAPIYFSTGLTEKVTCFEVMALHIFLEACEFPNHYLLFAFSGMIEGIFVR